MIEDKWQSELGKLHEQQKAEYREWVHRVHEDSKGNATLPSYVWVLGLHVSNDMVNLVLPIENQYQMQAMRRFCLSSVALP